jgi:integrase
MRKLLKSAGMTTLHDQHGHRKYLTPAERDAFLKAADDAEVREVRTFCATLAYTGCRISEALALTADRIDLKGRHHRNRKCKEATDGNISSNPGSAAASRHAEPCS